MHIRPFLPPPMENCTLDIHTWQVCALDLSAAGNYQMSAARKSIHLQQSLSDVSLDFRLASIYHSQYISLRLPLEGNGHKDMSILQGQNILDLLGRIPVSIWL